MADPQDKWAQYAEKPGGDKWAQFAEKPATTAPAQKQEPGFLDKEIPNDSYTNATLSGIQSVGRGVRGAVQGIGATLNPQRQPGETAFTQLPPVRMAKSLYETAKQIPEIPAAIHDINESPDPIGVYAKAGQETAGQGAGQALTALATEGVTRSIPKITEPVASRLYQGALKPSTTLGKARIGRMVDTGLSEKIPVSEPGVNKLGAKITDTNDAIADTINNAPTRTISPYKVASRLGDTAKKFSAQVNPEADMKAVSDSGNEFLRNQPRDIPGPEAQSLKQGTYRAIGSKAYGEMGSAATESQKALARGLKEELANAYPELSKLNETDSRLIDLHDALEKAVMRGANREPFGLGGTIAGSATKLATGSTALGLGAAALKTALKNPAVSSRLAIALKGVGRTIGRPGVGASAGVLGGISQPPSDRTTQQ